MHFFKRLISRHLLSLIMTTISVAVYAQNIDCNGLRNGDLLFVSPSIGNAVTDVTQGHEGLSIDHVAIVVGCDGNTTLRCVVEAVPEAGVRIQELHSFLLEHALNTILVGRMTMPFDTVSTISNVMQHIGMPYDSLFLPDNDAVYCSELVSICYINNLGTHLFAPIGMTFRNDNGVIPSHWKELYARHNMEVPEGLPGTNPGELSRRREVEIIGTLTP